MKYGNLTLGQVEAVVNKLGGMKGVKKFLRGSSIVSLPPRQAFNVLVDYAKTLKEMIEEGNYGWVNSNITQENFPPQGKGRQEVEIQLFHFGRAVRGKEVLEEMEKEGFRPATLPELLALGDDHPELQKEFPIVALGSRWRSPYGRLGVPVLDWSGLRRSLCLYWFEFVWSVHCRFAGVRK